MELSYGISGRLIVSCRVEKDGSFTDFKFEEMATKKNYERKGFMKGFYSSAWRSVLKSSGKQTSEKLKTKVDDERYYFPFHFKVTEKTSNKYLLNGFIVIEVEKLILIEGNVQY